MYVTSLPRVLWSMAASSFFRRGVKMLNFITKGNNGFDRVFEKMELKGFTEGHCVCKMLLGKEHTNGAGTVHGGFIATLIDLVTSLAIMSTGQQEPGISTDLKVSYLRAAKPGDEITIDATCIKAGRSLAFAEAEIKLANGKIMARGQHTKFMGKAPGIVVKFSDF